MRTAATVSPGRQAATRPGRRARNPPGSCSSSATLPSDPQPSGTRHRRRQFGYIRNSAAADRTANDSGGPRVAHPEINVTMDDLPGMHEALAAMREEGPVVEVRCNGERAWIVLTYEALRDALRDEETFPSAASYSRTTDPATGRTLNSMKGDEHTRNRAVVSPAFRRQRMAAYRPEVLEPACHRVV